MAGAQETCKYIQALALQYSFNHVYLVDMLARLHEEANGISVLSQQLLHCFRCTHQTAMVLQVLLLDELTTFLDSTDQQGVLKAVRGLVGSQGSESQSVTALWVSIFLHLAMTRGTSVQRVHMCLVSVFCRIPRSLALHRCCLLNTKKLLCTA